MRKNSVIVQVVISGVELTRLVDMTIDHRDDPMTSDRRCFIVFLALPAKCMREHMVVPRISIIEAANVRSPIWSCEVVLKCRGKVVSVAEVEIPRHVHLAECVHEAKDRAIVRRIEVPYSIQNYEPLFFSRILHFGGCDGIHGGILAMVDVMTSDKSYSDSFRYHYHVPSCRETDETC